MTTTLSPADLGRLVPPSTASRFGRGRAQLLAAYGNGLLDLPDRVTDVLYVLARTEVARCDLAHVDPGAARAAYNEDVTAALRVGRDLPAPDEVEDVERRGRLHDLRRVAIDQAHQLFVSSLETNLADGDALVPHVRPAVEAVHDEARVLLERHGPRLAGPAEHVVTAPAQVGKAWTRFGEIAANATNLRSIHAALTEPTAGRDDVGVFAGYRDDPRDPKLWGASYAGRNLTAARPWPTDDRGHLAWLLTTGLDLWVPTGPERDERWVEVFGEPQTVSLFGQTRQVSSTASAGLAAGW